MSLNILIIWFWVYKWKSIQKKIFWSLKIFLLTAFHACPERGRITCENQFKRKFFEVWKFFACKQNKHFRWRCAWGTHPFPYRTRRLRPKRPMILGGRLPGKVGGCRIKISKSPYFEILARFAAVNGFWKNPLPRANEPVTTASLPTKKFKIIVFWNFSEVCDS